MSNFNSNVRLYNSQRVQIAYLSVSVQSPPSLVPFSKIPPPSVYIFTIDKETGGIYHGGFPNIDIFPNDASFSNFLKSIYNEIFDYEDLGSHLIGATVSCNQLIIACVREKEEVAKIFNQPIYKISNVNFKKIALWNNVQPTVPILENFNLCDNHFFCPTLDISARFPYPINIISNNAFCWNKRFLMPFEENHSLHACIIVLQGAVFSMSKQYSSGFNIFYVIKRSAMFPGTRYNARGLNSPVDPANECECDLIFLCNDKYVSQSWRRGSPPVLWETEIKNLVVANHVLKENASNDTPMYFLDSIIQRFEAEKVCVISLLQKNGQESKIDEAYSEGVKTLSSVFPHVTMNYTNFDINALLKEKGIDQMLSSFYTSIYQDIESSNFTIVDSKTGEYRISKKDKRPKVQRTVFRFNCADSLDRTNVATFFYSLVLTAKFINKSGCSQFKKSDSPDEINLADPIPSLSQEVVDFLGNSFIMSGNIISLMYTNTEAIKTHIIRHFMSPTKESAKDNDSVVSVKRRFQNCVLDSSRQAIIDEWTSSNAKNPKFTLDEQHIGLMSRAIYENTSIVHEILESPIQQFSFIPRGDNNMVVIFPEPFILCSVSIFIVPNNIDSLLNFTLTIDSNAKTHSLFFHNITLPLFADYKKIVAENQERETKGIWISYDLRKMAKQSNYYPVEPLSLQPASFVSIRYAAFSKVLNLGNIRFKVKRPNNPRKCYYITGTPSNYQGKPFMQNIADIYKNLEYREQTLPELRSIELTRIENGINDYFRNNYIVRLKRNPWVYDLRGYSVRENKDLCCINCGKNASDFDKTPPFFITDSQYPITCVKTDRVDVANKKDVLVLCKSCKEIFDDQMQIQLHVLKNVSSKSLIKVNEYVGFLPTTFSAYKRKSFELSHLSKIFLSTFKDASEKQLQKLISGGDAGIEITNNEEEPDKIILAFPVGVSIDVLTVNFQEPVPSHSFKVELGFYDDEAIKQAMLTEQLDLGQKSDTDSNSNEENSDMKKQFKFGVSGCPASTQSIQITFERTIGTFTPAKTENDAKNKPSEFELDESDEDDSSSSEKGNDLKLVLSSISLKGNFKYISTQQGLKTSSQKRSFYAQYQRKVQQVIDNIANEDEKDKKKAKNKKKKADFPKFSETKCNWRPGSRTQEFKYNKDEIRGYAIKMSQNKENRPHSLILGFYHDNDYVTHESIVIPSLIDTDEVLYFPVTSRPTDFNNIAVFYLDRIGTVEPYKFMFFD